GAGRLGPLDQLLHWAEIRAVPAPRRGAVDCPAFDLVAVEGVAFDPCPGREVRLHGLLAAEARSVGWHAGAALHVVPARQGVPGELGDRVVTAGVGGDLILVRPGVAKYPHLRWLGPRVARVDGADLTGAGYGHGNLRR